MNVFGGWESHSGDAEFVEAIEVDWTKKGALGPIGRELMEKKY